MKVLVTGAAGFIGMHICERLLERGDEVLGVDDLNDYYDPGLKQARLVLTWPCSTVLHMAKAARVLAALKRDGWIESRRSGSHRVLAKGDQQRIWAYHDGVDLGGPAMARIARDYGYTLAELRKL